MMLRPKVHFVEALHISALIRQLTISGAVHSLVLLDM